MEAPVRRVNQMNDSPLVRDKGTPKKTIDQIIEGDLEVNGLILSSLHDMASWRQLIHVADFAW